MPETRHITIDEAVESFRPITLEEMDSIKLMNRIDTKYLTDEATLAQVLSDAAESGYRALVAGGTMVSPLHPWVMRSSTASFLAASGGILISERQFLNMPTRVAALSIL